MSRDSFYLSKYGAPPKKRKVVCQRATSEDDTLKAIHSQGQKVNIMAPSIKIPRSGSMTVSTTSGTSNVVTNFQTQSTEVSTGYKRVETAVPEPKFTNRIVVPGFDPSKYGEPNLRKSSTIVKDEAIMRAGTGITRKVTSDQSISSAIQVPPTSLLPTADESLTITHSQLKRQPEQGKYTRMSSVQATAPRSQVSVTSSPSEAYLPSDSFKEDGSHCQSASEKSSSKIFVPMPSLAQTISIQSHSEPLQMRASSLPPVAPGISKEDRLNQLQRVELRKIAIQDRTMGGQKIASKRAVLANRTLVRAGPLPTAPPRIQVSLEANLSGPPPSILPPPLLGISKEERLKQVQQARLKEIGIRNRTNDGAPETTSLRDLQLARTPAACEPYTIASSPASLMTIQHTELTSPQGSKLHEALNEAVVDDSENNVVESALTLVIEKKSRNLQWCTPRDLRPIHANLETGSNAWGSDIPSNASVATIDSTTPMQLHGRLFTGPPAGERDEVDALAGWDGKIQPPPVDWNDRPRFNNNSPAFKAGFSNWFTAVAPTNHEIIDRTPMFKPLPYHLISNVDWHADGITMVRRDYTLNAYNISKYGYDIDLADVAKYAEPVAAEDFLDWGKVDMSERDNLTFKEETTEKLVNNWLAHQKNSKKQATLAFIHGHATLKGNKAYKPEVNPNTPDANIYLRPAVRTDIKQLTDLYNWWVENSVRSAETRAIELSDMQERFDQAKSDRLPFLVGILKGKRDVPRDQLTGLKRELIVGFASATGFTALDYVEHIAAELEVYVHHEFLRQGVGRCLLDRLMCATDRGYMERGGYPFHCDPAERHWYEVGGARNLHKLAFVVRHHSRPKRNAAEETDITTWMKRWLVKDWDFEEEATLRQTGAKMGRFLDATYFSKFSKWLPQEGRVPGPDPKDHKHTAPLT